MRQLQSSAFPISAHAEEHDPPGKSRPDQEQEHTAVPADPLLRRLVPAATAALLTGALPPAGTVCRQNNPPFPG